MKWFYDQPVQRKLGYAMLFTSTLALILACWVFLAVEYLNYRRTIVHTVTTLARITANNSTAAIAFSDNPGAQQNLEALRAEPQIIAAFLYDPDQHLLATYNSGHEGIAPVDFKAPVGVRISGGQVFAVEPVVENSRRLGTLYLQASMDQIYERMRTYALIVLGVLLSSFALAGLIASVLRRTLARPILELVKTADAVSVNQDYSLRAQQYGTDELGQLTVRFNAMLEQTQVAIHGLQESEWSYRQLVRALPTAAYMCDARGQITIFNEAAVALWGRTPELGQESWCGSYRIFSADGLPMELDTSPTARSLRDGRAVRGEEIIIERPDGSRRNVLPHPEPIRDTTGVLVGIVNMLVDITEQKKADGAVRQLAAIVESSEDAIIGKDLAGTILAWNRGAEKLYGYTSEEMIGQPVTLLIPAGRENEEPMILSRIQNREHIEYYETVRQRKDGSMVDVSLSVSPIMDAQGRIVGASKIARDITASKRAKQQADFLSWLSQQLSSLAEPDEIIRHASQAIGKHLKVDRCYFCTVDEAAGRISVKEDWFQTGFVSVCGEHRSEDFGTPALWRPMAAGPLAVADKATDPLTQDQGVGYAALRIGAHASVPFSRQGEWVASLAVTSEHPRAWPMDEVMLLENALGRVWPTVERARTRRELQESERRQRQLMRSLPVACFTLDMEGRLTFFNDAAAKLWGQSPPLGETSWHGAVAMMTLDGVPIAPGQSPAAIALLEKRSVRGVEVLIVRPDGSQRRIVPHPDPLFDAHGVCTGLVNVVLDVTEERSASAQIQKAAERLSLAIASANLGDWTWDAVTDVITLSPRTCELYGLPANPHLTRTQMRDLLHKDDQERARQALQRAIETRTDYDIEYRVVRSDGTQRWIAAKGRSFHNADGMVSGMVGVVQDITERKLHAEALLELAQKIESQSRLFAATLSNLSDLAYAFDLEGHFIFANKPLLELWGRSIEEIAGKNPHELGYPPALADRLMAQIQEVIATKSTVRGETTYASASGKEDYHEYFFNPVIGPDGAVSHVVGSTRLITERKLAEETLRQNEEQLRLVTDNAPVLLVRTDREHRFTFVNRAFAEHNGFKPAEMIGMEVREAVGEVAYAALRPHMEKAFAGHRVEFEMAIPYERIGQRWVHVIYVPEVNEKGAVTGLLGVITDVGERKRAEDELKRARDEALAASRAKDDFLAALSHELRTPLNPVLLLASDAVNNHELSPRVRADFELILKNIHLEARLIDDLLDLTRITRGKLILERRSCNVHAILADSLATVQADVAGKNLQLAVEMGAARNGVMGDSVRLQQIFWNVLKNAVKFTPEGGRISVQTSTSKQGDAFLVRISDSGIGMTPDEIGRVFQAFSQGDHMQAGSAVHRFGGLGLGLTISKMLVEMHDGRIVASSAGRDQGSVFQVELPLCSKSEEEAASMNRPAAPASEPAAGALMGRRPPPHHRRILLVEDHAPTRQTLEYLLRLRNFEVLSAESAAIALRLAQSNEFDLIISDVGLPDRNGYELMVEIHSLAPSLPSIALSGYGMEEDLIRSQAAGFHAHLVKPVTIGMLEQAIASLPVRSGPPAAGGKGAS